ncbi:hypothetical protein [Luteibacter sp. 9135]|uniref:hypothetical protein n=1 Tax=Luteibacter sp. 9135 TaxID=1500893 RepID=UPI001639B4B7|nr:hypothetical protein [Luteibacter sp. 9135]
MKAVTTAQTSVTVKQEINVTTDRSKSAYLNTRWLVGLLTAQLVVLPSTVIAADAAKVPTTTATSTKVPKAFSAYGSTSVEGGECVAGNVTKEGMNGRAFVYFKDARTQQLRWVTAIPVSPDYYQNRATHCFAMGGSLFVLVQSDTNQATSLSQTLLNVVELSPADGKIVSDRYADVPGVDAAYSSWVDKGKEGFHEDHGQIKVSGQYFLMADPNKRMPFTATLPAHPSK